VLSLDIRFAGTDFVSPVPYRNAYMIESKMQDCTSSARTVWSGRYKHGAPSSCDCLKVGLGDERIPMIYQLCLRDIAILEFSKRPLVNNGWISRVVEQARCYPRLGDGGDKIENKRLEKAGTDNNTPQGQAIPRG
jgi:hypothetical protein